MTLPDTLQTYIKSNRMPPDQILPTVASAIAANDLHIKKEKLKLQGVNDAIKMLVTQQHKLQHTITLCKADNFHLTSLSAPYRRTPPEIISLIFRALIPHLTFQMPIPTLQDWLATLNIFTNVSKHWRNIAISDPVLWARLDLLIHSRKLKLAAYILQRWVANMHMDNLSLNINNAYFIGSHPDLHFLYQILDNSTRLRKLDITIRHTYPQFHLQSLSQINLPMLESLSITESEFKNNFPTHTRSLRTPRLTELNLNSVQPRTILHDDTLRQITKLRVDLNTQHLSIYHNLLKACPLLTDCTIAINYKIKDTIPEEPENIITLSHLITLSIEMNPPAPMLLSHIHAPALETLKVTLPPRRDTTARALIPFIRNTPSILQFIAAGFNVTREQKNFDHDIKFSHPNLSTSWINTNKIPQPLFRLEYDSGSETEPDLSQNASGPEEVISETESNDDY
jgi:hypothetical protein